MGEIGRPPHMIPTTLGLEAHAQPWEREVVDVESINRETSDALIDGVAEMRERACRGDSIVSRAHLILGPAGSGKTHLFGRLRRKLGPRAVLVHIRPLIGSNLTPRYLLGQVFGQLRCESYGATQIDALVGSMLAGFLGVDVEKPRLALEDHRHRESNERHRLVERIVEAALDRHPLLDEVALRAVLELPTLPPLFRAAWLNWLGGYELDPVQSARVGLAGAISDERVLGILRTLAQVASTTAPILLVFDQLENLVDAEEGHARVRAYGNLISELIDSVGGMIVAQMAVDGDWAREIEPRLGQAQRSRVIGNRHLLRLPDPQERGALLERWVDRLVNRDAAYPWPFSATQVERWCTAVGMTPRMLLLTAERALNEEERESSFAASKPPAPIEELSDEELLSDRDDGIAAAWQGHRRAALEQIDDATTMQRGPEVEHLLDGTTLLLNLFLGHPCKVEPRGHIEITNGPRLGILHETDPRSIAARLKRTLEIPERWLFLREQWREFRPTWRVVREVTARLASTGQASLLWISRNDVANLLALRSIVMQTRSSDLTDERGQLISLEMIQSWFVQNCNPLEWELGRELKSEISVSSELHSRIGEEPQQRERAVTADKDGLPVDVPSQSGVALRVLEELRVASLERLMREAQRREPAASRMTILAEIERIHPRIKWFGRAIVALVEEGRS